MKLPVVAACVAALALFTFGAQAQAPVKLVYATHASSTSLPAKVDRWFMEEVTKRSNGRITFESYFAGAFLPAPDLYPGLARGAVDITTAVPAAYNPNEFPLSNVILPYVTDKVDAASYAIRELYDTNPEFKKEYEGKGIQLLWTYASPENSLWTHKPITKASDLRAMRIRAVQGIAAAFAELGATTVPMSATEGLEAFKRNAIDGLSSIPFDSGNSLGIAKIADHVSDAGRMGVYATWMTSINSRKLASLDPDARKIVLEVAAEVPKYFLAEVNKVISDAADGLIKANENLKVVRMSDDEVAAWRAAVADKLHDKWIASVNARGFDGKALFDQYVGLIRKYETQSTYKPGIDILVERQGRK